ncbi:hypothetical protein MHYP_G00210530 [Metynnis hypsauchen]
MVVRLLFLHSLYHYGAPQIREEFRANAAIKKTDVMHIEYLCRRAQRQLEQLKDVNTKQLGIFSKTEESS